MFLKAFESNSYVFSFLGIGETYSIQLLVNNEFGHKLEIYVLKDITSMLEIYSFSCILIGQIKEKKKISKRSFVLF